MSQDTWGRKVIKTIKEINEEVDNEFKVQEEKFEDKVEKLSKKI